MAEITVTRSNLSEAVYQEVGLSRNESAELVESVLSEIADTLTRGETVKISSFGSFSVRLKGQRIGRNPKTGQEVPILPRKVLVFRASNVLKNMINGRSAEDRPADGSIGEVSPSGIAGSKTTETPLQPSLINTPYGSGQE